MLKRVTVGALGLLVSGVLLALPVLAGEAPLSFAESKALAASRKAPLLIKFGAEWCGPCKRFSADAAANAAVRKALEPVVLCDIDAEKGEGIELAKTYEIVGFPTFILVNPEGKVADRWMGYMGPADFDVRLTADMADLTPLEEREARFATSPTAADAEKLAQNRESHGDYAAAVGFYTKARGLSPDAAPQYLQKIFMAEASGIRKKAFTFDQVKATADEILAVGKATPGEMATLAVIMTDLARQTEKPETAVPYLTAAYDVTSSLEAGDSDLNELRIAHALLVLKDPARALELKRASMPEGWMEKTGQLNSFAWWCFENKLNLDEALALARKGVELAKPGREKAMILDTAAEICLAKGGCKDAVELAEQALKNDPTNKYYEKQLERFRKELAEATK